MKVIPSPARPAGIKANKTLPPAGRAGKGAVFSRLCFEANFKTVAPVGQADRGHMQNG